METDEKTIFVDSREPEKLYDKIVKWAEDEHFDVVVKRALLELFDVLYVNGDKRIGWELKRIATDDQPASNKEGRTKDQVKRQIKECNHPKFNWVIGYPRDMKYTDKKGMYTQKMEFNLIGVPTDTIHSDHWVAFCIVRLCQFYEEEKEIVFRAYCNPVLRDDSVLTKMMKQPDRIGDKTASAIGSTFKSFLDLLLTKEQRDYLLSTTNFEGLYMKVSNFVRAGAGKKAQKAPLQAFVNFINWFFGITDDSPIPSTVSEAAPSDVDMVDMNGRGEGGEESEPSLKETIEKLEKVNLVETFKKINKKEEEEPDPTIKEGEDFYSNDYGWDDY